MTNFLSMWNYQAKVINNKIICASGYRYSPFIAFIFHNCWTVKFTSFFYSYQIFHPSKCFISCVFTLQYLNYFACWVNFHAFVVCCYFTKWTFSKNYFRNTIRVSIFTVWIKIRPDNLSGLIWVQTVCKCYQLVLVGSFNQILHLKAMNLTVLVCEIFLTG